MYNEITSLSHFILISLFKTNFTAPEKKSFMSIYSTNRITSKLLTEIKEAIQNKFYGSVEIYIQDSKVTQITERVIKKLSEGSLNNKKLSNESRTG